MYVMEISFNRKTRICSAKITQKQFLMKSDSNKQGQYVEP